MKRAFQLKLGTKNIAKIYALSYMIPFENN